jgi:hypothetical protein
VEAPNGPRYGDWGGMSITNVMANIPAVFADRQSWAKGRRLCGEGRKGQRKPGMGQRQANARRAAEQSDEDDAHDDQQHSWRRLRVSLKS